MDLEEGFLKQNVPGRYSKWSTNDNNNNNGDDGHALRQHGIDASYNDDDDSQDDEFYYQGLSPSTAAATSSHPPPTNHGNLNYKHNINNNNNNNNNNNTGVKGVIADYREAQHVNQQRHAEEHYQNMQLWHRATHGAVREVGVSMDKEEVAAAKPKGRRGNDSDDDNTSANNSDDDEYDDSDDEELQQIRNRRLHQLQQQQKQKQQSTRGNNYPPLTHVTPHQYTTLVDTLPSTTYLIVHLYDPSIYQCRILSSLLEKLSHSTTMNNNHHHHHHHGDGYDYDTNCNDNHNDVRFIQVTALEAKEDLDTIVLPCVLIYRGGSLMHNLVRWMDVLENDYGGDSSCVGGGVGVEQVRDALENLGVMNPRNDEFLNRR